MKKLTLLIVSVAVINWCNAQENLISSAQTGKVLTNNTQLKGAFGEFMIEAAELKTSTQATSKPKIAADLMDESTMELAFGESVSITTADNVTKVRKFNMTEAIMDTKAHKRAKPISDDFNGFTIQLITSERALSSSNALFNQFGGIKVLENLKPKYSYFIGEFSTQEGAQNFINNVVQKKYPKATVIEFRDGKRIYE